MTKSKVRDLNLGDIVRVSSGMEYSSATVYRKLDDGSACVWRPYVHTGDFTYTGGVIPYIGLEDFTLSPDSEVEVLRAHGGGLR